MKVWEDPFSTAKIVIDPRTLDKSTGIVTTFIEVHSHSTAFNQRNYSGKWAVNMGHYRYKWCSCTNLGEVPINSGKHKESISYRLTVSLQRIEAPALTNLTTDFMSPFPAETCKAVCPACKNTKPLDNFINYLKHQLSFTQLL